MKVPYVIDIPEGASPGGHYGVIFAETQPKSETSGNAVVRKKRVGMIVYSTVNGDIVNKGEAVRNDIPFWQLQPPLTATVTAKNTGNNDFLNQTKLVVKDIFGNVKFEVEKDYRVLPDTSRTSKLEWLSSPWFGFYQVETTQKFLDQSRSQSGYVLMMPRFVPIALVVVVLIGVVYAVIQRRRT